MSRFCAKSCFRRAVTIMELVIAMVMITIIFVVVVPQFVIMGRSWDSKQGVAEAIQNGRVLMEHINRNLSKAVRISDVSADTVTEGFIEFEDNDGNTMRYDISGDRYVEYGQTGNLSDLAGPVEMLRFTCYDACDLGNALSPVTDTNVIRAVKVEATIANSASGGTDKTFKTLVYLRVNSQSQTCWENQDIGLVGEEGDAGCAGYVWTIDASGVDIWDYTDEFHYVYQTLSGDGQIIARVVSVENTDQWAKAGVMIRETLTGPSKHAMMVVTPGNGTAFQRRTGTGGSSTHTAGSAVTAPYWVKLVRSGNTFTGYESLNGSTWVMVGSDTLTMAADVYIGMAVTSHNDWAVCTAQMDNVTFAALTYEGFEEEIITYDAEYLDIDTPATAEGDLLIAAVATDGDTSTTLSPPAGWTEINVDDYTGQVTLGAWWRTAEASEPASYRFTWTGSRSAYGWMMCFTNQDSSNPINGYQGSNQTSATPTSPAITTTVKDCIILRLGAFDGDNITEDNPGLTGHNAITMDKSSGVLFEDGFETGFTKWTDGGTTDWDRTTPPYRTGSASAHAGSSDNDLISDNIDTSGCSSIRITFWYRDDDIDDNDNVYLQLYNGFSYANRFELGNSPEDVWHECDITINNSGLDAQYFRNNFRIKFEGSSIDSGENLWIDDVVITAGMVSGGAGYARQAATGDSGTSNFTLTASQESRMLTIAIAPADDARDDCCGEQVMP